MGYELVPIRKSAHGDVGSNIINKLVLKNVRYLSKVPRSVSETCRDDRNGKEKDDVTQCTI
jgi:hypothetical protein